MSSWGSLTLFTPNWANGLPGMPFPGDDWDFPTKDEVADYLEAYARYYELPDFAAALDPSIVQLHVAEYRNPGQLRDGPVLLVGAGNSGAEIAMELVGTHDVLLSGPSTGTQPFRPDRLSGRILMPFFGKVVLTRILSRSTPIGRKVLPKLFHKGAPLLRTKPRDLERAGVVRVGRTVSVEGGQPTLEDGSRHAVTNVVWCTGFDHGFSWLDLPVFDGSGEVAHDRGVVASEPGLFFVALKFQHSIVSDTLLAVGRDAAHVVDELCERSRRAATPA